MIEKLKKTGDPNYPWIDDDSVSHQNKTDFLCSSVLRFCSCGNNREIMAYILEFFQKLVKQEWGDYSDKPYMFLSYWADSEGFTEHGTTIRCSWLTDKGKELMSDIKWCLENEEK